MNDKLRLETLPPFLRSRRNRLIAAGVVAVVVIALVVVWVWPRHELPDVHATADGYVAVGCDLTARSLVHPVLDDEDGPGTTTLMTQAQLYGAAGRTDTAKSGFGALGSQLADVVQRKDATALRPLLQRLRGLCGHRHRTPATADAEALLACRTVAKVAHDAPTPAELGSSEGAQWAQLRAARYLALSAGFRDAYADLATDVSETFLAATARDDQRYGDAAKTVSGECGDLFH